MFDEDEYSALSEYIQGNIYICEHPANFINIKPKDNLNKILILFSGCLNTEMRQDDLIIWRDRILEYTNFLGSQNCELRLHPRTSSEVRWPNELQKYLEIIGLKASISKDSNKSFIDNLNQYLGIIGGPSYALKIASIVRKDITIFGISNCQDHSMDDQDWILGKNNRIHWLKEEENIESILKKKQSFNQFPYQKLNDTIHEICK